MKIMGIESSCDETGVGIVELREDGHMDIIANAVASSMEQHARFGGVVPEIASRAHLEAMPQVMQAALNEAGIEKPDAIAATVGPGLAGALLVGASAAKAYAAAWGVPRLGAAMTITLMVAGQLALSLLLDHFGALGVPRQPLNLGRIAGVALVFAGVLLVRRS